MLTFFYPRTIRALTTALLDLFNDIKVYNFDNPVSGATSAASKEIHVPVKFGGRDKTYAARLESEQGSQYYEFLPEISITPKSIKFSPERSASSNEKRHFLDDTSRSLQDRFFEDSQPTRYDFSYELKIRTNSMDHFCQITEQVLPYFDPSVTLTVKEFSFMNIERDLVVVTDGLDIEVVESMDNNARREINGIMSLTVYGYLYHPVTRSKIIKYIDSKYYTNQKQVSASSQYNVLYNQYLTSGYDSYPTSAFPNPLQYDTSAFNPITGIHTFTSGIHNI